MTPAGGRNANSLKKGSFRYHLRVKDERLEVCKNMFLNTLGLKQWSVRNQLLHTKTAHGMPSKAKGASPSDNVKSKIAELSSVTA